MASRDDVLAYLADLLHQVAGVDPAEVTEDKTFARDLDVDSLSMIEVVVAVEDRYKLAVSEADAHGWKTVGDAVTDITRRLPA